MKLELEARDLDTIAEKVSERLFEMIRPYLSQSINTGEKRLYSIREAAVVLGRGAWAIRHLINENKLPCIRDGKRIFIEKDVLDAWITSRKSAAS